ncbi:asparagine synthase-related protein [Streptomyces sp. BA2]|uniref:asparagine synthase-related protein n=1 Tax=Streptomyces sp. BA2 TaxID=436595 RepID=UPI00136DBE3F|nr:asparagine synthetase B family protein [Streptomyces sp. BA2]
MADQHLTEFPGCSGRITAGTGTVDHIYTPFDARQANRRPGNRVCQWTPAGTAPAAAVPQPVPNAVLALAGPLPCELTPGLAERVIRDVERGHYAVLRQLPPELAGAVVTPRRVVLFRGVCSADQLFFRTSEGLTEWSSDPRDLLDGPPEFDRETLWRACRGEDVFVFPGMDRLPPGGLAVADGSSARAETYDGISALPLPQRTPLHRYADLAYELLLEETRPYASAGRIGVLLSGGVDSAVVLAGLADHGADVTAYHMHSPDPLADELPRAREVCRALSVPLVTVDPPGEDESYFPVGHDHPLPFNHVWFRRLDLTARRIAEDGVRTVLSGLDGDIVFGPLRYGLYDVAVAGVPWRERWAMVNGLLSSRWELSRIVRSVRPGHSLYDDPEATEETERASDFLVPVPGAGAERYEPDSAAQEHTLNLTVWRPYGIHCAKPWGGRELRRLAARLPNAYRVIPYAGRTIDKPVLRLAAARRGVPSLVWRHYGRDWLGAPDETWCLRHPDAVADVLGGPDARLPALGVVDPRRLAAVITDPRALRRNAENLLCTAMVELFLRDLAHKLTPVPRE